MGQTAMSSDTSLHLRTVVLFFNACFPINGTEIEKLKLGQTFVEILMNITLRQRCSLLFLFLYTV